MANVSIYALKRDYKFSYLFSEEVENKIKSVWEEFEEYDGNGEYVSDVLCSLADSNVPIYYAELYRAVRDLDGTGEYCDQVVEEGLFTIDPKKFKLTDLLSVGYWRVLNEHLEINVNELLFNRCLKILEETDILEVPEDFEDTLSDFIEEFDADGTFDELDDAFGKLVRSEILCRGDSDD